MKKLICALLVAALAVSCALAETEPEGILGTINGQAIPLADAQIEFSYYAALYENMGMEDQLDDLRQNIADYYVQYYAVLYRAGELGLDTFTDEELTQMRTEADEQYAAVYADISDGFTTEGVSQEDIDKGVISYLESMNYTPETALDSIREGHIIDRFVAWVSEGVQVSDEDVRALYDEYVAAQKAEYDADPFYFEVDVMNEASVYYVPEGFRAVYHILLQMDAETQTELAALQTRQEEIALKMAQDGADQKALAAENQEVSDQIDALLADLTDKAVEIKTRLDAGEDFMALMDELGEDPGMQSEPARSRGYYVSADSGMWDTTFRDAAMALGQKGDVSEPVLTGFGLHLILYADDVASGPVDYESVRDDLTAVAQQAAAEEALQAAIEKAVSEAYIVVHPENLTYELGVYADDSEAVG